MKFSKATKLSAIIMTFVLVLGLVACSADKTEKKKSNVDIKTLMAQEPNDADEAAKLYDKLLQAENDILSNNSALWEKVFLSANKNTPMIEDGTNYGDFLLSTVERSKNIPAAGKSRQAGNALTRRVPEWQAMRASL